MNKELILKNKVVMELAKQIIYLTEFQDVNVDKKLRMVRQNLSVVADIIENEGY